MSYGINLVRPEQAHRPAKNAAISRASSSGSSTAAKWPPLGMGVHRRTLYRRSAHSRGGVPSSTKVIGENGDASWHVDKVLLSKCDSEPLVVVVEVIPHGRCDRLRYPVERHNGQQKIAGDPLIEITAGICPRAPLFQNPSGK